MNTPNLAAYMRASLPLFASQGWLSLPLQPALEYHCSTLFSATAYFALPPDAPEKTKYAAPSGTGASDEGFADLAGEKALITIRRAGSLAPLPHCAMRLRRRLELPQLDAFDEMSKEAKGMPERGSPRAASLLRLFRYVRPESASGEGKGGERVVAEAHKDLGILTLVVGSSPGLDARDAAGRWISVEDAPPFASSQRLTTTLLVGQSLTYLTGSLFAAGAHRVSVLPPPSSAPEDAYRYSLVFALRPAPASLISTSVFSQSPLIPDFPPERLVAPPETGKGGGAAGTGDGGESNFPKCRMEGQTGAELMRAISGKHWNVNVAKEVREEQKRKLGISKEGREAKQANAGEKTEGGEKDEEGLISLGAESRLG
ncbi:hypothetical protein MSAN_01642100 [Mycena sanguinolenta]|uniref:Fe2OG dioxygenase domain-containing protein n=1 Tax=Mycena sanguinolenta TaxID=230812 RepID=A0A8H6XYS0_9AGAR|nr:hypothetical protein MSAN_01642100 [Mycena sanguinolenta]